MSFTAAYTPLYPISQFNRLSFDAEFSPNEHDWLDEYDIEVGSLTDGQHDDGPHVDTNASVHGNGVRIIDWDGLQDELTETMRNQMVTSKTYDRDEYPAQEWQTLHGFVTWGEVDSNNRIDASHFNISRCGFAYSRPDAVDFWGSVSQYTEPFVAYNSPVEHTFSDVVDIITLGGAAVYRFICVDGEVIVTEIEFGVEGGETF